MGEKHFSEIYYTIVNCCIGIMMILMILLFVEYRFFCGQVQELMLLKKEYIQHIDLLQKKINGDPQKFGAAEDNDVVEMENLVSDEESLEKLIEDAPITMDEIIAAENSDAPDNDDDYADDSFIVINRHPDYLKQSTIDYFESQELNALMTSIDIMPVIADKTPSKSLSIAHPSRYKTPQQNKSVMPEQKMAPTRRALRDCGFIWPIDTGKFWLSSLFGPRKRIDGTWGFHHGIDMAAIKGTAVKAVRAGTVIEASFQAGYGNTVVIKHNEMINTRYAHLNAIRAHIGQKVKQGTIVGTVGETGFIRKKGKDGSHLHFEVYEHGKRINPLHCLPRN